MRGSRQREIVADRLGAVLALTALLVAAGRGPSELEPLAAIGALLTLAGLLAASGWRRSAPTVAAAFALSILLVWLMVDLGAARASTLLPAPVWGFAVGATGAALLATLAARRPAAGTGRGGAELEERGLPLLAALVLLLLVLQFGLAVAQSLDGRLLVWHVLLGVAALLPVVVRLVVGIALSASGLARTLALLLGALVLAQVSLGLILAVPRYTADGDPSPVLVAAHRWVAALLLPLASSLWTRIGSRRSGPPE